MSNWLPYLVLEVCLRTLTSPRPAIKTIVVSMVMSILSNTCRLSASSRRSEDAKISRLALYTERLGRCWDYTCDCEVVNNRHHLIRKEIAFWVLFRLMVYNYFCVRDFCRWSADKSNNLSTETLWSVIGHYISLLEANDYTKSHIKVMLHWTILNATLLRYVYPVTSIRVFNFVN